MDPIRLYHWRGKNFGDALSPLVVAHVSGRQTIWAPIENCELFAVGSLLQDIREALPAQPVPPWMWGTGTMDPGPARVMERLRVAALRGPVTATVMRQSPALPFGDPGLFVSEMLGRPPARGARIGIVPHHSQADLPELRALIEADPRLVLIDTRSRRPMDVVRRIGECRFILSSSLHGLIVADALGVPNHWLNPIGIHRFPALKFIDYAASVGRLLGAPLDWDQVPGFLAGDLPETLSYASGIAASREALRAAFPDELKAH